MFGYDILKRQQEVIERQEEEQKKKKIEKEKENLRIATNVMEEVKSNFSERAEEGKSLEISYEETLDLKDCFDNLRKLGWKEGISVSHGNSSSPNDEIITFEIIDFTVRNSFKRMCIDEKYLTYLEQLYLDKEQEYSMRLSDQETFSNIQEEIVKNNDENKILFMNALLNAAYRNGMEGEIPEVFPLIKEIKPTIENFIIPNNANLEKITNYMHILHNHSKEKQMVKK